MLKKLISLSALLLFSGLSHGSDLNHYRYHLTRLSGASRVSPESFEIAMQSFGHPLDDILKLSPKQLGRIAQDALGLDLEKISNKRVPLSDKSVVSKRKPKK